MPSGETSRLGGSEKPSEGMNFRSSFRKLRSPRNSIGPLSSVDGMDALTLSFCPAGASNAIWLIVIPTTLANDSVKVFSSPWMVTWGSPPVSGMTMVALRTSAWVWSPLKVRLMNPPSAL